MPIVPPFSNHRIPPQNARSGDVARATLEAVLPAQNRKYHEAFRVNGYPGILYRYKTSGPRCACQSKSRAINARLDEEGKAPPGAINEIMTGTTFGFSNYGSSIQNTPDYAETRTQGRSILEVSIDPRSQAPLAQPTHPGPLQPGGLPPKKGTMTALSNNHIDVVEEYDEDADLTNFQSELDVGAYGYSDTSCPICFGSGHIGGFDILNGYRKVVNFQDSTLVLPADAVISVEKRIPGITTRQVAWNIIFPASCVAIDAFRVWNDTEFLVPGTVRIDGDVIASNAAIMALCDGRPHDVEFTWPSEVELTHFEFQVNLSTESIYFELPRLSKNANQNIREATNPFSVNLSPLVPHVKPLDVIVESTFGKALHVKDVTGWNERRFSTLGWDVEVRPTQPQELFSMLPRRSLVETMNRRQMATSPAGQLTRSTT